MRLILTILLIGLLKADAQMVINASAPYRPTAIAVTNLLLDDYSGAAAAYSLRKLDKDYAGSAIRVRKDTTGQPEQDIGFTASGDLDTASMKTFVGNNNGFVVTWYDQSGNARNQIQATQANQPRIINSGTVERNNNNVAVLFDGSNDVLRLDANTSIFQNIGAGSIYSAYRYVSNPTTSKIIYFNSVNTNKGNTRAALGGGLTNSRHSIIARRLDEDAASILSGTTTTNTTNKVLVTGHFDYTNGDGFIYLNGSSEATNTSFTSNGNTSNTNSINSCIGAISTDITNVNNVNAHIFEIIVYQNIDNRSGIESNINTYYSIY